MQGCSRFAWRREQANQHVPLSAAPGQECGLAPRGRSTQSQSQHLAVLDSEITMKSVNHSRPSLRTVHLLPSRPSYPEACGLLGTCTHTPIENSLELRLLWILSHSSPLMSYVSLDKYTNLSKVSFPFLQNKNSTASLADTIWITD